MLLHFLKCCLNSGVFWVFCLLFVSTVCCSSTLLGWVVCWFHHSQVHLFGWQFLAASLVRPARWAWSWWYWLWHKLQGSRKGCWVWKWRTDGSLCWIQGCFHPAWPWWLLPVWRIGGWAEGLEWTAVLPPHSVPTRAGLATVLFLVCEWSHCQSTCSPSTHCLVLSFSTICWPAIGGQWTEGTWCSGCK